MEYRNSGIFDAKNRIQKEDNSVKPLLDEVFSSIDKKADLNAFTAVFREGAYARANSLDDKLRSGQKLGRLFGIPITIKDNIAIKNETITCASNLLKGSVANENATVVDLLLKEDAIIVGKTNMDEFAMGGANTYSAYGRVKNPVLAEHVPGGSSGGSACSVSAGLCLASLGTDTGGSVRQPAAFCGIVGNKPTYGSICPDGVMPMAPSFDQVGALTNNVEDNALINSIISRQHGLDAVAQRISELKSSDDVGAVLNQLQGKRIAIAKEFEADIANSESASAMDDAIELMTKARAQIVPFSIPELQCALEIYKIMMSAEAAICLSVLTGREHDDAEVAKIAARYAAGDKSIEASQAEAFNNAVAFRTSGFGEEVKKRIFKGAFFLSHNRFYEAASKTLAQLKAKLNELYQSIDVIIWPTAIVGAFMAGEEKHSNAAIDLSDKLTIVANLTGRPAVSVPCGITSKGLPLGLHLMGKHDHDAQLFMLAGLTEKLIYLK